MAAIAGCAIAAPPAEAEGWDAATITWTGAGDGFRWSDWTNWDLGRNPVAGDRVVIPDVPLTSEVVYDMTNCCGAMGSVTSYEPIRVAAETELWIGAGGLEANRDVTIPREAEVTLVVGGGIRGVGVIQLRGGEISARHATRIDGTIIGFGRITALWPEDVITFAGAVIADTPPTSDYPVEYPTLSIQAEQWTNVGTLKAVGGKLDLGGNWSSAAGRIIVETGTVELGGTFGGENLASIVNVAGHVRLTGRVENHARVATIGPLTGDVTVTAAASIHGGTVVVMPGTKLALPDDPLKRYWARLGLHGVHIIGDVVVGDSSHAQIYGTVTIDGTMTLRRNALLMVGGTDPTLTGAAVIVLDGGGVGATTNGVFRIDPTVTIRVPDCESDCWPVATIGFTTGPNPSAVDNAATILVGRGRTLALDADLFTNRGTIDVVAGGRVQISYLGIDNRFGILRSEVDRGTAGVFVFETYSPTTPAARLNGTLQTRLAAGYIPSAEDVHEVVSFRAYDSPFDAVITDSPGRVARYYATGLRIESGPVDVLPPPIDVPPPPPPPPIDVPPPPVRNARANSEHAFVELRWEEPERADDVTTVVRGAVGDNPPASPGSGFGVPLLTPTVARDYHPPDGADMSYSIFRRREDGRSSLPISVTLRGTHMTATQNRAVLTYGESVTLRGRLVHADGTPVANKAVGLRDTGRNLQRDGLATTAQDGSFVMTYAPRVNGRLAAMFDGDSSDIAADVAPVATRVRTRVKAWIPDGNTVAAGDSTYLRGRVLPSKAGKLVRVQRWDGTRWRLFREKQLTSTSRFSFRLPTRAPGRARYRVVKRGDGQHIRGVSRIRRLTVDRPN